MKPVKSNLVALIAGLLSLPLLLQLLAMGGFVIGHPIAHWQFVTATLLSGGVVCLLARNRCLAVLLLVICLLVSIAAAGLQVMFSVSDGNAYQRAGVALLAKGWNPLYQTEPDDILRICDGAVRRWHISFLPRTGWIYGAALYKCCGFCEIMDSLGVLMMVASIAIAYRRIREWTGNSPAKSATLALLVAISPFTVASMFGGTNDTTLYALIMIGLFSLERYLFEGEQKIDAYFVLSAFTLASGLKYTGCVLAASSIAFAAFWQFVRRNSKGVGRVLSLGVFVGIMILLANASPYLTSTIHHTSPFYPAHTFERGVKLEDRFTGDFEFKNDDANAMGGLGRFAYAYVSKSITAAYYRWRLNKKEFEPEVRVFDGICGFGGYYRALLWISLALIPIVKIRGIQFLVLYIFLSLLLQPAKYIGYVRYVAQIYMIPALTMIGLTMRYRSVAVSLAGMGAVSILAIVLVIPSFKILPYAWLASVQNLQILEGFRKDPDPLVEADSIAARASWSDNACLRAVRFKTDSDATGNRHPYSACAHRSVCWMTRPLDEFYSYGFADVDYGRAKSNEAFAISRRTGAGRYFLRTFLPGEVKCLSHRFRQLKSLRKKQMLSAWK